MDVVRGSADLALLTFLLAWLLRVYAPHRCSPGVEPALYAMGGVLMLAHIVIAYGVFHHWSHAAALAHTAQQSKQVVGWSFASGLYVNFGFIAIYGADVLWRYHSGGWQFRRPAWLAHATDGFLWFIVAMSTIVFESGAVRVIAIAGLSAVLWGLWQMGRSSARA